MSDLYKSTEQFIKMCIEQSKQVHQDPSELDCLQGIVIQLVGKVLELEGQIKELKNEQLRIRFFS